MLGGGRRTGSVLSGHNPVTRDPMGEIRPIFRNPIWPKRTYVFDRFGRGQTTKSHNGPPTRSVPVMRFWEASRPPSGARFRLSPAALSAMGHPQTTDAPAGEAARTEAPTPRSTASGASGPSHPRGRLLPRSRTRRFPRAGSEFGLDRPSPVRSDPSPHRPPDRLRPRVTGTGTGLPPPRPRRKPGSPRSPLVATKRAS